jgi:hypothetical protein
MLTAIVGARFTADRFTAEVAKEYLNNPILKVFPVPRVDLAGVTLELKFAIISANDKDPEVIIEADKLREIDPGKLSTARLDTGIKNYRWTKLGDTDTLIEGD